MTQFSIESGSHWLGDDRKTVNLAWERIVARAVAAADLIAGRQVGTLRYVFVWLIHESSVLRLSVWIHVLRLSVSSAL